MFSQAVLRFFISLRETFSNSVAFSVIIKYGKGAMVQISTMFPHVYKLLVEVPTGTGLFRRSYNHVFQSP